MANELIHASQGTSLTQAEFEAVGLHVLNSQATGDLIYASSATQLSRLAIGATSNLLQVIGGIPSWTSEIDNITLDSSVAKGTWTASGTWTIPAVTLGGALSAGSQVISNVGAISMGTGTYIGSIAAGSDSYWMLTGGLYTGANGATIFLFGKSHAAPGQFSLYTPNAALAVVARLDVTGAVNTAVATWSNITHTNIKLTGAASAFGAVVLPTGAGKTVDEVITDLQNLGLVTQV